MLRVVRVRATRRVDTRRLTDIQLAKNCLDVGLYTNRADELRAFYATEVGLPYEELLKAGGGVHQHRYGLNGGVLKINSARALLSAEPTAFARLVVAAPHVTETLVVTDPDGTLLQLVPAGTDGVSGIAVEWRSSDPQRLASLLVDGLDGVAEGDGRVRVGTTLIMCREAASSVDGQLFAVGFRYLTVQVRDVRAEHARLLQLGWVEARPPVRLGDVAFISFVKAPDGGWLEVSQRASLTGPLPHDA